MSPLRALARVNVAAIERNVGRLRRELPAGTELCAVVKADGYGHGALPAARAALAGGATWLAVASANSAALLRDAESHFDLVRAGVAIYGLEPFQEDARARDLEPALELASYVAAIKPCAAGESAGYGRRFVAQSATVIATVPIGYGDGVSRALTNNAELLVGAKRFALVGTVSMDNVTLDLGAGGDAGVQIGDEALLIAEGLTAEAMAQRLGTINYEVTCALTARVPREHHRDGAPL